MKIALSTTDYVRFLDAHELAAEREAQRLEDTPLVRRQCICRAPEMIGGALCSVISPSCLAHGQIVRAVNTVPYSVREKRADSKRHAGEKVDYTRCEVE